MPEGKTIQDYLSCKAEYVDKNGNSAHNKVFNTINYSLSKDNKSIKLFIFGRIYESDLEGGRATVTSESIGAYNIHEVIYEVDYEGKTYSDYDDTEPFDEELIDRRLQELGITEDDCRNIESGQKIKYCWCDKKIFELPFEISFDLNYKTDNNISKELTIEDAPNVIKPIADKVKMEITPFAVYLYGQCDKESAKESGWSGKEVTYNNIYDNFCFSDVDGAGTSKIVFNDGTVYCLHPDGGGESGVGKDGNADYYKEEIPLAFSTVAGSLVLPEFNAIDTREVKTVIINGDTVYSK